MKVKDFAAKVEARAKEILSCATPISSEHAYRRDFKLAEKEIEAYIDLSQTSDFSSKDNMVARLVIMTLVEGLPYRQPKLEDVTLKWRLPLINAGAPGTPGSMFCEAVAGKLHFKADGEVGLSISKESVLDVQIDKEILWIGLNFFAAPADKIVDSLIENMPYLVQRHSQMCLQAEWKRHENMKHKILYTVLPGVEIAAAVNARNKGQ